MRNDKYELTNESIMVGETKLYRIKALKDISFKYDYKVKAGELGGYVESCRNLSCTGSSWIANNAYVYGNAKVFGNAQVSGDTQVSGNAYVYGDACVYDNAQVYGNAKVYGDAQVYGDAYIYGDAYVEFAKRAMALPKYRTPHIGSDDNAIDVTYGMNINGAETKFINGCKELICSVVRILSEDMDRGADIINSLTDEQQSNLMFGINGPLLTLEPFAWKAKYSAYPIVDGYYMYDDWGLAEIGQALDQMSRILDRLKGNSVDISEL